MQAATHRSPWTASVTALVLIVLWDLSGLDVVLARAMGGLQAFPLRDNWFLGTVAHTGAKYAAWVFEMGLCLLAVWPAGPFARLPLVRRVQLATTVVLASGLVALLKANSLTSCPWDLHEFGGLARHLSHWSGWFDTDGGAGRCFPAGHASTGFAFLGGYFALRHHAPRMGRRWLMAALGAGALLGICQQLRGAHFLSHTLWTGWICWMTAFLTDPLFTDSRLPHTLEATP